jgi:hypothetical protein
MLDISTDAALHGFKDYSMRMRGWEHTYVIEKNRASRTVVRRPEMVTGAACMTTYYGGARRYLALERPRATGMQRRGAWELEAGPDDDGVDDKGSSGLERR